MSDIRIVFMGTPEFAVPSLRALAAGGHRIAAVVSQPDRPQGRKRLLVPTPVKAAAEELGIPVLQPERVRRPEAVEAIAAHEPDLIVTAAYGQILPKALLDLPRLGCINVHGSLLPKYRGGAPIQRAIMNGETVTGVTIMYMAEGLDTGDMISKVEVPIEPEDTAGSLFAKLSEAGADLLIRTLPDIVAGTARAVPQNDAEATYAPNLTREDERLDWSRTAKQLYDQVRGLVPFSGGFTLLNGEVFKVWKCRPAEDAGGLADARPGAIRAEAGRLLVAAGDGWLELLEVQPAGKKAMPAAEWLKGTRLPPGASFGG
jgi:methionyl-tRNA formyltransferase